MQYPNRIVQFYLPQYFFETFLFQKYCGFKKKYEISKVLASRIGSKQQDTKQKMCVFNIYVCVQS